MDREKLINALKAVPFTPFTLHVVDGDLIGVRSPEFVWVPPKGKTVFIIQGEGDEASTRMIGIDYISQMTVGPGAEQEKFPSVG